MKKKTSWILNSQISFFYKTITITIHMQLQLINKIKYKYITVMNLIIVMNITSTLVISVS